VCHGACLAIIACGVQREFGRVVNPVRAES
jgi:hypothetical protein